MSMEGQQEREPKVVYETGEVPVPEELREKGYAGMMKVRVVENGPNSFNILRIVSEQQPGLQYEPTRISADSLEEAKAKAEALLTDWEGLVND